jgi:hypothetical protein
MLASMRGNDEKLTLDSMVWNMFESHRSTYEN